MSAMSYRRSSLYRFRTLIILAALTFAILVLSTCHHGPLDETTRAASIIGWMKDGGYEILLPTAPEGSNSAKPTSTSSSDKLPPNIGFAPQNEKVLRLQSDLRLQNTPMDPLTKEFMSWRDPATYKPKKKPLPKPPKETVKPIPDPFPLLSQPIQEVRRKLVVPKINRPPKVHVPEPTPLLIGFTRNWPQLLQCVSSYIAAGWPAEDIHVVENTGAIYANRDNQLTLQNPFYLNHTQLHAMGVRVIVAPTLLTFAQLQNYYAWLALERGWADFFWSHQDVVAFSFEREFRAHRDSDAAGAAGAGAGAHANYPLYARAVAVLRYLRQPGTPRWANHFFAYDHLALVHRDAVLAVGGWDTHIPFYATDCDLYLRQRWAGFFQGSSPAGIVIDTSTVLDDLAALFRVPGAHATFLSDPAAPPQRDEEAGADDAERRRRVDREGETIEHLVDVAYRMQAIKYVDGGGWRNAWQLRQGGGKGEPFYRDQEGFQVGLDTMIEAGRRVFADKWGHRGCDIFDRTTEDAWNLQRDWIPETEGKGFEGEYW